MSLNLASAFGAGWQFFSNQGVVLAGGKLFTYLAGSTTPTPTWVDSSQVVANSNPMILDSAGRLQNEVWLQDGVSYKFVLTDYSGAPVGYTWDNITGCTTLSEWVVSVRNYGAVGDGSADDTSSINAAISANQGKAIYFPSGTYKITSTINISNDNTFLRGDGPGRTAILNATASSDAIVFACASQATIGSYLNSCGLSGMTIYRTTDAATGAGIGLLQCNQFLGEDFIILNHPEGLRIAGGQLGRYSNFLIESSATLTGSPKAGTSLIRMEEAPIAGGLYQKCYTQEFVNFSVTASPAIGPAILLQSCDGANFTNGYINGALQTLVEVNVKTAGQYISAVTFDNCYFDGVSQSTGTLYGVIIDNASLGYVYALTFNDCFLGNYQNTAVVTNSDMVQSIEFIGCEVANTQGWGMQFLGSTTNYMQTKVSDCRISGVGSAGGATGGVQGATGRSIQLTDNQFTDIHNSGTAIALSGSYTNIQIQDNSFNDCYNDYYSTATASGQITIGGNASNNASPTAGGVAVGNRSSGGAYQLDWFEKGTFTPTINFGGGTTGITYTLQSGFFTRIGNVVEFCTNVVLSSKGSSTGAFILLGLPYASAADNHGVSVRVSNMTGGVGDTAIFAFVLPVSTGVRIDKIFAGGGYVVQLADTDFTNTSGIIIAGHYRV